MSVHRNAEARRLRERARYFFAAKHRRRAEVHDFAEHLGTMGRCAVVGGMLRDLFLDGNRSFSSDVDFVADVDDLPQFDKAMTALGARGNRFGGYSIALSTWTVDVWPLQRTWASRNRHAEVTRLEHILHTTFFDWDAVLYFPATGRLAVGDRYFEKVSDRVLDINLAPNPNPLGNAVRAIRYARRWNARLAAPLAQHVEREVRDAGWETFVTSEARSFATRYLDCLDPGKLVASLREARHGASVSVSNVLGLSQTATVASAV